MKKILFILLSFLLFAHTYQADGQTITGATTFCDGTTSPLTGSPSGGTWSSSSAATVSINSAGLMVGLSAGTATISYTPPSMAPITVVVTVFAAPAPITGITTICESANAILGDATAGGAWSTSNASIAAIDALGIVSGLSPGTANISYTVATGCSAIRVVSINPLPSPISGTSTVCAGSSTSLISFPTSGGTWVSSNPAIGIVGPTSGFVTGIAAGTTNITYTIATGCRVIKTVSVNSLPLAITGTTNICLGNSTALSDAIVGGTWSTSNPLVAAIDALTGIIASTTATGTALISYTIATGCAATTTVIVNAPPLPIFGPSTVCIGTTPVYNSSTPGGVWSSSATSIATVGAGVGSFTTVTGISAGVTLISYMTGPGCVTSTPITVALPPDAGTLSGPAVICIGTPAPLSPSVSGGAWTSSSPGIASVSGLGVVTGFGTGLATISYSVNNICGTDVATMPLAVNLPPSAISGPSDICGGTGTTLTDFVPGGTWLSSDISIATIGSSTGAVSSSLVGGITVITYSFSSACFVTKHMTIDAAPSAIGGVTPVCQGGVIALTDALPGGTWTSSNPAVAIISTLGGTTGSVTGISAGTATITYGMVTGCTALATVTVNPLPTIATSATPASCGGTYTAAVSGGVSYMWLPSTGLSCDTCATAVVTPSVTTTYTVTGTSVLGCTSDVTVVVPGDRIYGHVYFSAATPSSLGTRVWLIQYNAVDSSIVAIDSVLTCMDVTTPFFEFDSKPSGFYMIRSRLLSSTPGTSGYLPTYGGSSAHWFAGSTAIHTGSADNQDITMIYGTAPTGGGSISGTIYSGEGTSGDVPVEGMLVFLKNATTGEILTYTYTNVLGSYSFAGITFGTYVIYPEEFSYYTTPCDVITLSEGTPGKTLVNFKEHTTLGTITPMNADGIATASKDISIDVYPNPASGTVNLQWAAQGAGNADFVIRDVTGREVLKKDIAIYSQSGTARIDISDLKNGIYFVNIQSGSLTYSGKLLVHNQ